MPGKRKRTSASASRSRAATRRRSRLIRRRRAFSHGRRVDRIATRVAFSATTDANGDLSILVNSNGVIGNTADAQAGLLYDGGSVVALSQTGINSLSTIYDSARCTGIRVQYIPELPNGATAGTFKPLYYGYDRDGFEYTMAQLIQGNPNQWLDLRKMKVKNMYRPWSQYFKFPYYSPTTKVPTFEAGSATAPSAAVANQNLAGQWHVPTVSLYDSETTNGCHVAMAMGNGLVSTQYGQFIVTIYSEFKDRKLN